MICEISNWESEGGRLYPVLMRDTFKSVVHKKKQIKRPFFYAHELSETMQNSFITKPKKSYDNRTALQKALPTIVRGSGK